MPKYVIVTGGVLSGVGKGTTTASLGLLLKNQGYSVSALKIDPYLNVDAGTMRPTEHGECYVTKDGAETDQDLGSYERYLDIELTKKNIMTTGVVFQAVIQRERNLEYEGKCVQVIPHIPQEIATRIKDAAEGFDILLIEVGGTSGDYENILFLEALREMKLQGEEMVFTHVVYLPIPASIGEMKTKPAQLSVRELQGMGIQPDFIIGRSAKEMDDPRKEKLALFSNLSKENIIGAPNVKNIYEVPMILEKQSLDKNILEKFGLPYSSGKNEEWNTYFSRKLTKKITVGIIGKYFDTGNYVLKDSYISVIEAVKHAAWDLGVEADIQWINAKELEESFKKLEKIDCIIVPGGFGKSGTEGKINGIKYAREHNIPFLGLCLGMQLAVVEFARNACGMEGANTAEIDDFAKYTVIDIIEEQKELIKQKQYGGTMRLGDWNAKLVEGTKVAQLYGKTDVVERHRHRYEVNPKFVKLIEECGLVFSGSNLDTGLKEFIELPKHPYFIATQAHPEFKSRIMKPHPLFKGLLEAVLKKNS